MTIETATLPAAGSKILVDKISPDRLAQVLKLAVGTEGVLTLVTSGAGDVDAGTLRITLAGNDVGVASIVAAVADLSTKLTTIDGRVDGLEGLVTSTNSKLDAANTSLDNIETAASDTSTPVPIRAPGAAPSFVPVLDTAAYAAGDVLWTAITTGNLVPSNDQPMVLQSVTVIDKDDEGPQMTLYFFSANVAFGTVNSPPSISDADAVNLLGIVDIAAADFKDLGGVKVASKTGLAIPIVPVAGGRNIYCAATTSGTPTYTSAADISVRLGVI